MLLLLCVIILSNQALADYPIQKVIMQCSASENKLLLRFGTLDSKDIPENNSINLEVFSVYGIVNIPKELSIKWIKIPYTIAGDCNLANGQRVTVSTEYGPSDEHEPVPDAYFTMKINNNSVYKHYLFDREITQEPSIHVISAIEYDGYRLV